MMSAKSSAIKGAMLCMAMLAGGGVANAATLTLYAAGPRGFDRALAASYEKASGDHVDLWASSTGKVLARLEAEANNPHADVVILADQSAGLALQEQGMLLHYRPRRLLSGLRPELNLPSAFLAMGADTVALAVNTSKVPTAATLRTWRDLLKPALRNQVSMPNPLLSGTAADFVLGFLQHAGPRGWSYFAKLKARGAIWPGPNAAALAPVKLGARSVLMAAVGHTSLKAKKQGNSLDLILPTDGTLFIPRPIVILKSSRHVATAKRFVDFVLSRAGQKLVAKALMIPALRAVAPNPIWPDLGKARFWTVDWKRMARTRAATLKRFDATVIH